jgi:hypothetical protein
MAPAAEANRFHNSTNLIPYIGSHGLGSLHVSSKLSCISSDKAVIILTEMAQSEASSQQVPIQSTEPLNVNSSCQNMVKVVAKVSADHSKVEWGQVRLSSLVYYTSLG